MTYPFSLRSTWTLVAGTAVVVASLAKYVYVDPGDRQIDFLKSRNDELSKQISELSAKEKEFAAVMSELKDENLKLESRVGFLSSATSEPNGLTTMAFHTALSSDRCANTLTEIANNRSVDVVSVKNDWVSLKDNRFSYSFHCADHLNVVSFALSGRFGADGLDVFKDVVENYKRIERASGVRLPYSPPMTASTSGKKRFSSIEDCTDTAVKSIESLNGASVRVNMQWVTGAIKDYSVTYFCGGDQSVVLHVAGPITDSAVGYREDLWNNALWNN